MKGLVNFFFIFILFTIPFLVKSQSSTGKLHGKILNEKLNPIPFASIGVFKGGILIRWTRTNVKGEYLLNALPTGNYSIEVKSVGYGNTNLDNIEILDSDNYQQNITLQKGHCIPFRLSVRQRPNPDCENPNRQTISREELINIPN